MTVQEFEDTQRQLQALISLAKSDGVLSLDEVRMIRQVAAAKKFPIHELNQLFSQEPSTTSPVRQLTNEERFKHMCTIVQLMKVDARLYPEEVRFCKKVAYFLGYNEKDLYYFITEVGAEGLSSSAQAALFKRIPSHGIA